MLSRTTTIIESTIKKYEDEKSTTLLNPTLMDLRKRFREEIEKKFINDPEKKLIRLNSIKETSVIDRDTIIEINNNTTSERRAEFLNEVINYSNSQGNLSLFINNSTNITREYINNLLIRYSKGNMINDNEFRLIGNTILYSISNLNLEDINIDFIMRNFREVLSDYNNQQMIPQIREEIVVDYRIVLENQRLLNEEQLNVNSQQFWEGVKEREEVDKQERLANTALSRRRILITGGGILASMALSSYGITLPGVVSLMSSGLNTVLDNSLTPSSIQDQNIVRVRDIWDLGLKKLFNIMK